MKTTLLSLLFVVFLFVSGCGGDNPFIFEDDFSDVPEPFSIVGVEKTETESGLIYYNLEDGTGDVTINIRDIIQVHYTGRRTNGEIFDSSYKNGSTTPLSTTVTGLVLGFSEGLIGMKEGGKRVLVVPPYLGYEGTNNSLDADTLVFDIEIIEIAF